MISYEKLQFFKITFLYIFRCRFKEQHPDKAKDDDVDDFAKYFEDATARELRLIYESQNAIHLVMQQMEQKLQSIIQQQNQHTQLINTGNYCVIRLSYFR